MTTPKAPSIINPDIPPPPLPGPTIPPGNCSLSPDNSSGASTKRSHTVYEDAISSSGHTASAGLPVNKVAVITQPPVTNTHSLDSSIHAHPIPTSTTVASQNNKCKSVAFAMAYLRDMPDAFKDKFTTNCSMCDEVDCSLSCYPSYGACARCDGSDDNKKILVFFNNQDDFTDCINSSRADLFDLAFTHYSPADAKLNAITQFNDIWTIICLEADLLEIVTQVNAKALNVPLSVNSYKPKPYVYLNFFSFDTLEAAKELSVAFRGKGLTWHLSNEAHTLCHVCGCPGCSPSPNKSTPTSPSNNSAYTLPQHIIDDLKAQIKKIANTLSTLDETVF
ncbi:hypothetical protein RhiirC2_798406 [Rhizophagus irregularis]|uniref:RRM domain-containing protein n=1 Tax=Rhizophagus irregularis TaxID=588596 RepID=A0A2N1M6H9_9GLOM|nr:hypothetical protein RhiirC2_798406 [Rhizophagus irregularis]